MARLQRIPRIGDFFDYEGHRFTVEAMEGHRIARVRIEHAPAEEEKASSRPFSNTA
jgi:CBS domain containing-hemolysin-like protein